MRKHMTRSMGRRKGPQYKSASPRKGSKAAGTEREPAGGDDVREREPRPRSYRCGATSCYALIWGLRGIRPPPLEHGPAHRCAGARRPPRGCGWWWLLEPRGAPPSRFARVFLLPSPPHADRRALQGRSTWRCSLSSTPRRRTSRCAHGRAALSKQTVLPLQARCWPSSVCVRVCARQKFAQA